VHESEEPENLADYTRIDDFQALPRPARGAEAGLRVRFDPNPEPCYRSLRAGVAPDALGLVVAGLDCVRVFRTRDVVTSSFGAATRAREFYLAVDIAGPAYHRGLVRDVAWAPGAFRGYDMLATACQDGFVRVFRVDTPLREGGEGNNGGGGYARASWAVADITGKAGGGADGSRRTGVAENGGSVAASSASQGHQNTTPHSGIRAEIDKSGTHGERASSGQPGQIPHTFRELSRLESHRSPVWKVGFDDDGQILGSVGDEGKLICYRQKPDGTWAKSSELGMTKQKLVVPQSLSA
jgi:nucleoporin SEH1